MYVIKTRVTKHADGSYTSTDMLTEMTKAELRNAEANMGADDTVEYNTIGGPQAHRWVRRGQPHETPLYIDNDNRVRRN